MSPQPAQKTGAAPAGAVRGLGGLLARAGAARGTLSPRLPRVLLVAPYAPQGGGMGRIMAYLAQAGCPGFRLSMVESRGARGGLACLPAMATAAGRIISAALAPGPAVLHVNMGDGGSVFRKGALLLLGRALGLPAVLHLHAADLFGTYAQCGRVRRTLMRAIFGAASLCIVLGAPWRDFLCETLRVPPRRIVTLRNGVPRPVAVEAAPAPRFRFVFLGNLLLRKGLRDLLAACADPRLAALEWELVIAGGGDQTPFRTLAAVHDVSHRVTFTGWLDRPAVTALLSGAGAFVLPSAHEALPLVLAEAAGLGLPIITTPAGAVPELFAHNETALLVPPHDAAALATAMLRLLSDPTLAARLGEAARALYEYEFAMPAFTGALAAIYRRALGASAR